MHTMARINVLGGTGYAGGHIVREAASRGHQVVSFSRTRPADTVDGVDHRTGSVLDEDFLATTVQDADVVFESLSPRGELAGRLEGVMDRLIALAADAGVRLGVMGGASSLLVAPGGPRLFDEHEPPAEVRAEVLTGLAQLEALRAAPQELDWFFVSPAQEFGAWVPGEALGRYRVSDDVLLRDEAGRSFISGADLAKAVVDEIERPAHHRARFHVAY
jgi:putative NADH-flavin reductase